MFILPSIVLGLLVAVALGGRPSRLLELRFRATFLVFGALAVQIVALSRVGASAPAYLVDSAHLGSYALLVAFGALNLRIRALWLLLLGMLLNGTAIAANGGRMPLSRSAGEAAGVTSGANVDPDANRLSFLGDIFAVPSSLPLANVFSVGDLLVGIGMVLLIVHASLGTPTRPLFRVVRLRAPFASADFRALSFGRLVSTCGDWLTIAALVGWVYAERGSTFWVAALLLARIAPPILGAGVAARIADRRSSRGLLVAVEITRGAVALLALAAVVVGAPAAVVACVAISAGLGALTGSVVPTLVPALVQPRRYPAANAILGGIENAGMAVGALAGGYALHQLGIGGALAIDAATFAVAAAAYARIRVVSAGPAAEDDVDGRTPGALRVLLRDRRLTAAVGCFVAAIVATGLANATMPRLLGEGLSSNVGAYGFGLGAIAIGLTLGQLAVGLARIGDGLRWLGVGLALMAALFVGLSVVEHAPTVFLILGVIGFVDGTTDSVFDTVVQREAAPTRRGAVFGSASAVFATAMVVSVAAAPALNEVASAGTVMGVGACALVVASVVAFVGAASPRRRPAAQAA